MSIEKKKTKSGVRYLARKRVRGKRVSKTFSSKLEAVRWETSSFDPKAERHFKLTIEQVWAPYIKKKKLSRSRGTIQDYEAARKHQMSFFQDKTIDQISESDCVNFQNFLSEMGLSNRSINKHTVLLKSVFRFALTSKVLSENPSKNLEKLPVQKREKTYWEKSDVRRFIKNEKKWEYYEFCKMAIFTGMRLGEILALDQASIDTKNKLIRVIQSRGRSGLKQCKNSEIRYLPIHPEIKDICSKIKKKETWYFESVNPSHFTQRIFKPYILEKGYRSIRFHDLRHTFASHFMMNNGSIFTLQKLLGHKDIANTMIYAHLSPSYLKESVKHITY